MCVCERQRARGEGLLIQTAGVAGCVPPAANQQKDSQTVGQGLLISSAPLLIHLLSSGSHAASLHLLAVILHHFYFTPHISSFILTSFCAPFIRQTHAFRSLFLKSFFLPHLPSFLYKKPYACITVFIPSSQSDSGVWGGRRGGVLWRNEETGYIGRISQGGFLHYLVSLGCFASFPHLHFLPCPPFSVHLLFFFSVLDPLSFMPFFIFTPVLPSFTLSFVSSLISPSTPSLLSPLLSVYSTPDSFIKELLGLCLHTSAGDL